MMTFTAWAKSFLSISNAELAGVGKIFVQRKSLAVWYILKVFRATIKHLLLFFLITDSEGSTNKYGMVQYMFDGPEIDIKVKPHGNSKTATPFFTTSKKTREHIQELATKSSCKHVIQAVTSEQGGEINARGAAFLPRNRQQVANF